MFRTTEILESVAPFARNASRASVPAREAQRSIFDAVEEVGTLMPVYREIAQRLSRNAYTSYGATL